MVHNIPYTKTWPDEILSQPFTSYYKPWFGSRVTVNPGNPVVRGGRLTSCDNHLFFWLRDSLRKAQKRAHMNVATSSVFQDIGGPFEVSRSWLDTSGVTVIPYGETVFFPGYNQGYGGAYLPQVWNAYTLSPVAPPLLTKPEMNGLGTKGIAQATPTNPLADLATFIGELRQVPNIPGRSLVKDGFVKGGSGDYLNYEFGLKPVVNDLTDFRSAIHKADRWLSELRRTSGRPNRRRRTLRDDTTTTETNLGTRTSVFSGGGGPYQSGTLVRVEKLHERVWFSGAFTHYFDLPDSSLEWLREVYGTEITPDVIWNLLPYSWLTDWFANVGEIAQNVTRFSQDGLILNYGYVMRHAFVKHEYTYYTKGLSSSWTVSTEVKQRQPASPFGFGIETGSFTDRQISIIAALGFNKLG